MVSHSQCNTDKLQSCKPQTTTTAQSRGSYAGKRNTTTAICASRGWPARMQIPAMPHGRNKENPIGIDPPPDALSLRMGMDTMVLGARSELFTETKDKQSTKAVARWLMTRRQSPTISHMCQAMYTTYPTNKELTHVFRKPFGCVLRRPSARQTSTEHLLSAIKANGKSHVGVNIMDGAKSGTFRRPQGANVKGHALHGRAKGLKPRARRRRPTGNNVAVGRRPTTPPSGLSANKLKATTGDWAPCCEPTRARRQLPAYNGALYASAWETGLAVYHVVAC